MDDWAERAFVGLPGWVSLDDDIALISSVSTVKGSIVRRAGVGGTEEEMRKLRKIAHRDLTAWRGALPMDGRLWSADSRVIARSRNGDLPVLPVRFEHIIGRRRKKAEPRRWLF